MRKLIKIISNIFISKKKEVNEVKHQPEQNRVDESLPKSFTEYLESELNRNDIHLKY